MSERWERFLHSSAERRSVDRRKPIQFCLETRAVFPGTPRVDQTAGEQLSNIGEIAAVPPLHLRKRLCVEIKMIKSNLPLLADERTAILPSNRDRNEVQWRR